MFIRESISRRYIATPELIASNLPKNFNAYQSQAAHWIFEAQNITIPYSQAPNLFKKEDLLNMARKVYSLLEYVPRDFFRNTLGEDGGGACASRMRDIRQYAEKLEAHMQEKNPDEYWTAIFCKRIITKLDFIVEKLLFAEGQS
jgi:hypothetical protein